MNNVNLIGNISTDIELRFTPSGHAVASFNVAVTNPYNREKTSFIPVQVWRQSAENTANFCQKGSKVGISGMIEVENYEKDGQYRTFTRVVADRIEFLTPKKDTNGAPTPRTEKNEAPSNTDPFGNIGQPIQISDSDLPF